MTRPYSVDLRERALARVEKGETLRSVAALFGISPSCISKWGTLRRRTGDVAPGKVGGHKKRALSGEVAEWLRARMRASAFTLRGLAAELAERGVKTEARAVWVFVHAEGLSYKKTLVASEQSRPDVARKRMRWKARQAGVDPKRLVFVDETWVKTNMEPLRGWGPEQERLRAPVPHGHWKTLTFVAALRHDRIDAPWVIDGPINGEIFSVYVKKVLAPTLVQGEIVVLDNLGSHKGKPARAAIRAAGAHMLFLPPYSPDLNPIEQVFAKLKHLMRKARPRAFDETWKSVGQTLDAFAPDECANYLKNSGYVSA
ncbi:MAG TPA: IS630 family transposase [Roseiarcus sp.]|nr:IS630 family transposase [Roseiarcus sp.]